MFGVIMFGVLTTYDYVLMKMVWIGFLEGCCMVSCGRVDV